MFFCCDACGETIKRSKVEAHCRHCTACWSLSCVDCGQVFEGDAYWEHVTCISEAEKYQGSTYRPKDSTNKGLNRQQIWVAAVARAANIPGNPAVLRRLGAQENVPRKLKKFCNFVSNGFGVRNSSEAAMLFKLIQGEAEKLSKPPTDSKAQARNNDGKKQSGQLASDRKRKRENDEDDQGRQKHKMPKKNDIQENPTQENIPNMKDIRKMLKERKGMIKQVVKTEKKIKIKKLCKRILPSSDVTRAFRHTFLQHLKIYLGKKKRFEVEGKYVQVK